MDLDWENMSEEDKLEAMKNSLLSSKEKKEEKFIDNLMTSLEKNDFTVVASADLNHQEKLQQAQLKLAEKSIILAHRFNPLLKEYVASKEQKIMNDKFAIINILTNRRQPGDNMLQLLITGCNSCGKTMIFENPLLGVSHMVTTEKGVSGFNFEAKSTMLLHDVNLTNLIKSSDCDRLKAIARGEPVPAKTHGSVQTVPSVFTVITSNQRLFTHTFLTLEKSRRSFTKVYKSDIRPTKNIHPGDIAAIQARFMEAFV